MKKIPIWIDTDTGVDDAVALLVACKLEQLEIVGASAVAGNTIIDNAFKNARNVFNLASRKDIKVYKGADKPLIGELHTAAHVHGEDGLGGAIIEESSAEVETMKAWDALYLKAKELNGELTLCTLGPLTNIALTIIKYPDFVNYVKTINMMLGALDGGNVTPSAEFNAWVDPYAAETVFKSGIKINMFGLDVTKKAYINNEEIQEIINIDNKAGKLFKDSYSLMYKARERVKGEGICGHDTCPIMYTAYNDMFKGEECGIYAEYESDICFGKTVSDLWSDYQFENQHCKAFLEVDRKAFVEKIIEIYRSY